MTPWFIATEKFDQSSSGWKKYIAWSGLEQVNEVISLDSSLCPTVLPEIKIEYWNHIVKEDFMIQFFTDLDYLRGEIANIRGKNLLCVFRNPPTNPRSQIAEGFEFIGYDLLEKDSSTSAITNCGGFPAVFSNSELQKRDFSELTNVAEKCRTHYASNIPTSITPTAISGLSFVFSNDCLN